MVLLRTILDVLQCNFSIRIENTIVLSDVWNLSWEQSSSQHPFLSAQHSFEAPVPFICFDLVFRSKKPITCVKWNKHSGCADVRAIWIKKWRCVEPRTTIQDLRAISFFDSRTVVYGAGVPIVATIRCA